MTVAAARPIAGGPLAVDLLNTTWKEGGHAIDWLDSDLAVTAFTRSWGHDVPATDVDTLRSALVRTRSLAQRLLSEPTDAAPTKALTDELNQALTPARTMLSSTSNNLDLIVTGDRPSNAVAIEALVNAVELRRDQPGRVRSCAHDDCVLWFLDTSKSGRRRWCSMETCGNRAKAKRHYQRSTLPKS